MIFAVAVVLAGRLIGRLWSGAIAAIAAACTVAGLLVASTASTLAMLAVGYVGLVGGANGLGYLTAVDVASREFDRRRGLATGLVVGAYAGGPLLAGPVAGVLLPELGWRGVMVVLAIVLGSVMLGAAGLIGGSSAGTDDGSLTEESAWSDGAWSGVLLLWAVFFTGALPALLAFGHAASIAPAASDATHIGGLVVAGMAVGNVTGRTVAGAASDRIGRRPALVATLWSIVIVCLALGATRVSPVVVAGLVLLGIAYGGLSALVPAATADLVGPHRFGRTYGWVFSGWGVAGLLGPLVGAALYDRTGAYLLAFRVSALIAVIGVACDRLHDDGVAAHSHRSDARRGEMSTVRRERAARALPAASAHATRTATA